VEILPQYSFKAKAQLFKRKSDAVAPPTYEEDSDQVSQIEHVYHKRDDILDDSLLFALQEEPPRYEAHLEDEEGNVEVEATDL
jgi:hypothetical protein